jgi:hypothetical protein
MRQAALPLCAAGAVLLAGATLVVFLLTGSSNDAEQRPAVAAVTTSTPNLENLAPTATSTAASTPQVTLSCYPDKTYTNRQQYTMDLGGDFAPIWAAMPKSCEATRGPGPLTALEQQALTASGHTTESSISTLYGLCASVDPDGAYVSPQQIWSPVAIAEVTGMLTLCPGHPQAALLNESIVRIQADAAATAAGELFEDGTYRVGEEIKPGTYAIEGLINDCYWERNDRNGEIIDNWVTSSVKRVQVTIRSSDYSFHSERCGKWRKVT